MNHPFFRRWRFFAVGLLLLAAGVVLGLYIRQPLPEEPVTAAFAPQAESGAQETASPAPSQENWFLLDVIDAHEVDGPSGALEGTQTTSGTSGTPGASSAFEALPTPAPTPTLDSGFVLELVQGPEATGPQTVQGARRVLIYHTHTYEAYEPTQENPYKATQQWRTLDEKHNMVRVGEELASVLRGMGITVVHDTTAFEPPDLSSAYTRSLGMLEQRKAMGEQFDLYIDLHRDAYVASQPGPNAVMVGETSVARLMMLIGKGEGQTAEGFLEKPNWQENLVIAQQITDGLNGQVTDLAKEVRMKSGRFNQHISVGCVLVEVGNNHNTLEEALAAMPYLADAISQAMEAEK